MRKRRTSTMDSLQTYHRQGALPGGKSIGLWDAATGTMMVRRVSFRTASCLGAVQEPICPERRRITRRSEGYKEDLTSWPRKKPALAVFRLN